ncbi:MAG: VTT domain-containing protein [Chloroflexi bacterium]|nr:VTT domain-containing protein [Chloroflexota bacterium]
MPQARQHQRRAGILRGLALVFVIAISVAVFLLPESEAERLRNYGYPGIFLFSILANATVILPAPGLLLVFSFGARFHPLGVALAAAAGAAIGELSGYLAGFGGQAVFERADVYARLEGWMRKNGPLTVMALAFVPNPFFDLAGMAAGALRMPVRSFLFWVFWGKLLKMILVAYAGAELAALP